MTERPLVVVADDEEDILVLVDTLLSNAGFEVVSARDGCEALELLRTRRPAIAVLDVSMPKLTGLEVLQEVRANAETAEIPIVLLSARAQEADVARGWDTGASGYVRKPFKASELVEVVRELAGRQDGA